MTQQKINAFPAKRFFVDTLIRDIDLTDAILDLLDNCVDGAMREKAGGPEAERPHEGKWAKIHLDEGSFIIEDNCGGISLRLARDSAFMMGRRNPHLDPDLPTVGAYGIGMKRAIF